jgi:alginate O-acetyltransferase complex protein AlgI
MTLGSFFSDYVYIPLGGNRVSAARWVFNTLVVWALTGLWHGASWNFLLWGLWYFVFQLLERAFLGKALDKLPVLRNIYLLLVVLLGWVLFRYSDLRVVWTVVRGLFGGNGNALSSFTALTLGKNKLFLLVAAAAASTPLMKRVGERLDARSGDSRLWSVLRFGLIPAALLILSTAALVGDSYNPFIYFQF